MCVSYNKVKTALVVDDEEPIRNILSRLLTVAGHRVLTASDGEEGVSLFREHMEKVDFVLLDVVMPRLNGPDTFAQLRRMKPEIPVLFVTAFPGEHGLSHVLREPRTALLRKPFRISELWSALEKVYSGAKNSKGDGVPMILAPCLA